MRIAFVVPELLHRRGAENLTLWLAAGLRDRGHQITLLAPGIDPATWPEIDFGGMALVELPAREQSFWRETFTTSRHGRLLAQHAGSFDLVVAGNFPTYLWLSDAVARVRPPWPTMLYCHEPFRKLFFRDTDWPMVDYLMAGRPALPFHDVIARDTRRRLRAHWLGKRPFLRWRHRRGLRSIDTIVANSEFTAANATKAFGRPVEVCLPGVPDPCAGQALPRMADRHGVVVLTGWGYPKNPEAVLGAVSLLANRFGRPDIRFTVVGGAIAPEQQAYLRDHGLEDQVVVRGFVSEDEKHRLLSSARLCLFVPWAEPFGLVPVEAMFHGTPVVGSSVGGPAEVVVDGETGRLVDCGDPSAIAAVVAGLHDDIVELTEMSLAGRLRAQQKFSLPVFLDRFEACADRAVKRSSAAP